MRMRVAGEAEVGVGVWEAGDGRGLGWTEVTGVLAPGKGEDAKGEWVVVVVGVEVEVEVDFAAVVEMPSP